MENNKSLDSMESLKKSPRKRQIANSFLKKRFFKDDNLVRIKCNYAFFNEDGEYLLFSSVNCSKIINRENERNKEIIKKTKRNASKKKNTKWLNFLYYSLNILVIAIILVVQLSKENSNPSEFMSVIKEANWGFIWLAFATFVVNMVIEQIRYAFLIHKATGVFRFRLSYKLSAVGRYYDTITPLGTGGQPFQVLYLNKYGIKAGEGISIAMGRYIFYQIVYFVLVTFFVFRALFFNAGTTFSGVGEGLVSTFMWIGYIILVVLIVFMLLVSLNRKVGTGFVAWILKFLSKIRIGKFRLIKDYKKSFVKVMRTVNVWQSTTKKYSKSFWVVFVNIVGSIAFFFVNYSMPYFIYCAFCGWSPQVWLEIISIAVMVDLTSAFNPIPMGTGTADLSFTVLYSGLFASAGAPVGASVWALIIWRILCYYIYIIQGLVIVNYDYFIGNKRLEKYKDYWMLPIKDRIKFKLKNRKKGN